MSLVNVFILDLDLKRNNYISEPVVTSSDTVRFIVNVTDDELPFDLTGMSSASIGHTRPDGIVVLKAGTKTGNNQLTFDFGTTETEVPGRVDAKVQIYDVDGRVSTLDFGYMVTKDPTGSNYVPSEKDKTLIEQVLGEGPEILADAQEATTNANNAANNANTVATNVQSAENARVIAENQRVTNEDQRIANEQTRQTNEATRQSNEVERQTRFNTAITNSESATNDANAAAVNANEAATNANNATTAANTATQNANDAADAANVATTNAETATTNAETATQNAIQATTDANTATTNAETATQNAIQATTDANTATNNANDAADAANQATDNANTATNNANDAADAANSAAESAQNIANNLKGMKEYDHTTSYKPNNIVTLNGSSYMALIDVTGVTPGTDPNIWQLVAQKGRDGTGMGTVTSVTSINEDISVTDPTSDPVLTLNSSVSPIPNSIVKRDVDGNIDEIGDLDDLMTTAKKIVPAVNELDNKIEVLSEQLSGTDSIVITLNEGTQVIDAVENSNVTLESMSGRTIINELGNFGNFRDRTVWFPWAASVSSTNGIYTLIGDGTQANPQSAISVSNIGYKPVVGDVLFQRIKTRALIGSPSSLRAYLWSSQTSVVADPAIISNPQLETWYDIASKITVTQEIVDNWANMSFRIAAYYPDAATAANKMSDYTEYMVVKLPESEKGLSTDELLKRYPYVENMKSIFNPYVISDGKNLLPPFYEWDWYGPTNTTISPYEISLTYDGTGDQNIIKYVPVVAGQVYTYTCDHNGKIGIDFRDKSGRALYSTGWISGNTITIVAEAGAVEMWVYISSGGTAGTFTFKNPMLILGSDPEPFEPQQRTYQFIETELRSNPDGTQADELYVENGETKVLRKQGFKVLDGSLPWLYSERFTGFKRIGVNIQSDDNFIQNTQTVVKYDGKILDKTTNYTWIAADVSAFQPPFTVNLQLSVSNEDSGWGETYTPTQDEIKAYFNGWRMFDKTNSSSWTTPYNRTDGLNKGWAKMYNGVGTEGQGASIGTVAGSGVSTLPTELNDMGFTPYQLQYQLATPVVEVVETEGEVMLHEGLNQVTVGAGVIIREYINPIFRANYYRVNDLAQPKYTWFKHRVDDFAMFYENDRKMYGWRKSGDANANGRWRYLISPELYDASASHSVTYFALDRYKLGIAPQSIGCTYEGNLNEVVNQHTEMLAQQGTRLSVVENEYARKKQPDWIEPTLFNGWAKHSDAYGSLSYYKDDFGIVHFEGALKDGVVAAGTMIAQFPVGYRPRKQERFLCFSTNGTSTVTGMLEVIPSGKLGIPTTTYGSTYYNNLFFVRGSFRAEQ